MKKTLLRATVFVLSALASTLCQHVSGEDLVDKNVYAYDITVNPYRSTDPWLQEVRYKLSGQPSAVDIEVYSGSTLVRRYNGERPNTSFTNNENVAWIDLRFDDDGRTSALSGTLTFKIKVTSKLNDEATLIKDKTKGFRGSDKNGVYQFYAPWTVTVNNCPESDTFGRILVAETKHYSHKVDDNKKYHSSSVAITGKPNGVGSGIYQFDQQMQPIVVDSKYGYQALGEHQATYSSGWTAEYMHVYQTMRFTEDGRIFLGSADDSKSSVYQMTIDSDNKITATSYLSALNTAPRIVAMDVVGKGENLKMLLIGRTNATLVSGATTLNSATNRYYTYGINVGNTTSHNNDYDINCASAGLSYNFGNHCAFAKDGKSYYATAMSTYKGGTSDQPASYSGNPGFSHYKISSNKSTYDTSQTFTINGFYTNGTTVKGGLLGIARNADGSLLAVQTAHNSIRVYNLNTANGTDNRSLYCDVNLSDATGYSDWTSINDMAFDYADNLYITSNGAEKFVSIWLPNSTRRAHSTPVKSEFNKTAPDANSVTISSFTQTSTGVKLKYSHNAPDGAIEYRIERRVNNGAWKIVEESTSSTTYNHNFDYALSEQTVRYRVTAWRYNILNNGTYGTNKVSVASAETSDITVPALSVSLDSPINNQTSVDLNWSISCAPSGISYNVYRGDTYVGNTTSTSYSVPINEADNYKFTIKPVVSNEEGTGVSTSLFCNGGATVSLSVNYDSTEEDEVFFNWIPANLAKATQYELYRDNDFYATIEATSKTFTIGGPEDTRNETDFENPHEYHIVAYCGGILAATSNTVLIGFINPYFEIIPEIGATEFGSEDLVRLKGNLEWNRPMTCEYIDANDENRYILDHYHMQLFDSEDKPVNMFYGEGNKKVLPKVYCNGVEVDVSDFEEDGILEVDDPITDALAMSLSAVRSKAPEESDPYAATFTTTFENEDITFGKYTAKVTPVYKAVNGEEDDMVAMGAEAANPAEHSTEYFTPVSNLSIMLYRGTIKSWTEDGVLYDKPVYRSDISFDRPIDTGIPVSYYTIEYRRPGDVFKPLENFWVVWGDDRYRYKDGETNEDGYEVVVPGMQQVRARIDSEGPTLGEKIDFATGVSVGRIYDTYDFTKGPQKVVSDAKSNTVAYHYSDESPVGTEYQVTAYYGAANQYLLDAPETNVSTHTSSENEMVTTGVEELYSAGTVKAWPIPAHDRVNVQAHEAIVKVDIYNAAGGLVKSVEADGTSTCATIGITELPAGIYLMQVNGKLNTRIIKK